MPTPSSPPSPSSPTPDLPLARRLLESPDSVPLTELVAALTTSAAAERVVGRFSTAMAMSYAGSGGLREDARISSVQATRLGAAIELGRRTLAPPWDEEEPFCEPEAIWHGYRSTLGVLAHERLVAIGLDGRCRRVVELTVAEGQLARCVVEPGQVFRPMMRAGAHAVLLVHNHPSGDPTPSVADRALTGRLASAGQILGIPLADHVVVSRSGYHSMAESGGLQ